MDRAGTVSRRAASRRPCRKVPAVPTPRSDTVAAVAHFVTFLFDSHEGEIAEGSVAFTPNSRRPADLFQWKVTSGTNGEVSVRSFGMTSPLLIGTARWEGGKLTAFQQEQSQVPSDRRWIEIERHLARLLGERVARAAPDDPALVDRISWLERRHLYDRVKTNWDRKGPRYDRHGKDLYFERKLRWTTLAVVVLIIGGIVVASMPSRRSPRRAAPRSQPATPAPAATMPARVPPPTTEDLVARAASFTDALALAQRDPSGLLLAHYPGARWSDVAVPPETSIARVQKDAEPEYGKRLCVTGTIAMITRSDVATGKRFVGRLVAANGDSVEFVALGTTGDLLRGSATTLCGAVVGLRGDAPVLVGLFDLPENRTPLVEQ